MKTIKLFSMAALTLALAACSIEDNAAENRNPSAEQGGKIPFTATIAAPNSGAATRSTYSENGGDINVAWKMGEEVALIHNGKKDVVTVGAINADGSATISGTIDATGSSDGEAVTVAYPAASINADTGATTTYNMDYISSKGLAQDGTLEYIADHLDIRQGSGKLKISGKDATLNDNVELESHVAILNLSLTDGTNPLSATKVTMKVGRVLVASATSTAKSDYYLCVVPAKMGTGNFTYEAVVGNNTYTYTRPFDPKLAAGDYNKYTLTMAKAVVNLSSVTTDTTVENGYTITGTLGSDVKISIAAGATVTLKDATINRADNVNCKWAGLTALGDATIILEGSNTVKGFFSWFPGILAAVGKTLTIRGTGSLSASSNGYGGIGGGSEIACGNIVIEGGTITATSGDGCAAIGGGEKTSCGSITISGGTIIANAGGGGAGIGSGNGSDDASCGSITITGGTVTATGGSGGAGIGNGSDDASCGNINITGGTVTAKGGEDAAGIGSGYHARCGDINITSGVTRVTATKGEGSPYSIGAGDGGIYGLVFIGDVEGEKKESPFTYPAQ